METNVLDALGKLWQHGHGMFGWCSDCGSPSRYWNDVKARRTAQAAAGRRVRYRSYCASVASAVASIAPEPFDPIFCAAASVLMRCTHAAAAGAAPTSALSAARKKIEFARIGRRYVRK